MTMAIKEIKREWSPCQLGYVKTFLLHTEEDMNHMPPCSVGSMATVAETDNEYVKTNDGWKLLCDCDEDGGTGTDGKMNATDPTGTGALSIGRKAGTTVGKNSVAVGLDVTANGYASHAEGNYVVASGNGSHAEGIKTNASGDSAHTEGSVTTASGYCSHAEGSYTTASGRFAHAEGYNAKSTAISTHAEGYRTNADGDYSHAEGYGTTASGNYSHAEGWNTVASEWIAHAEGIDVKATGNGAHAEGRGTIAAGLTQHAQGKYNAEDKSSKYAHIVGNGKDADNRSNAHTIDWEGNAWYAGTVEGTAIILKSATEGSEKRFRITVDDEGVLSATEITD